MKRTARRIMCLLLLTAAGCTHSEPEPWYCSVRKNPPRWDTVTSDKWFEPTTHYYFEYESAIPPFSKDTAYGILLNTELFSDRGVGPAGGETLTATAYDTLLNQPEAEDIFINLLDQANTAGQLYALCGLYTLKSPIFKQRIGEFLQRNDSVRTAFGCFVVYKPTRRLVRDVIVDGTWPKYYTTCKLPPLSFADSLR